MIEFTISEGTLTPYERHALTLSQMFVLAAFRQLKTYQRVAKVLHRDEPSVRMMVVRIKKRGVTV